MNHKRSRLILALLVIALLSTMGISCPGRQEKTKIVIWDGPRWPDENDNKYHWIESKIEAYEKENTDVDIELVQVPWAELGNKLSISIASKEWPDIAPVDLSGGAIKPSQIEQGIIEPLDTYFADDKDDFFPAAVEAYMYDGKMYGVPTSMSVHSLLINLDLFEEAGVEPPADGRWTWEEFRDKMKQLTFDRDGDGEIDVYGFSTYVLDGYYELWPFLYMDGGRPLNEDRTEFTFDDPKALSAMRKMADLKFVDNAASPDMGSSDVGEIFKNFASPDRRTVAVQPWNSWAIASLQTNPNFEKPNFDVVEYPIGESGEPVTIGGAGGWIVFNQESDEKKDKVVAFLRTISDTETNYTFATEYGTFPARESAQKRDPFADNPQMAKAADLLQYAETVPQHPNWAQIDDRIQSQLQLIFNGEKTPEQAMEAAATGVEQFLKD